MGVIGDLPVHNVPRRSFSVGGMSVLIEEPERRIQGLLEKNYFALEYSHPSLYSIIQTQRTESYNEGHCV